MPRGGTPTTRLALLAGKMERAWSASTSADPANWTPDNPALGQCAVTAVAVWLKTGMPVVRGRAVMGDGSVISHYWNAADGNEVYDLTASQFKQPFTYQPNPLPDGQSVVDYVLKDEKTAARYRLLMQRLAH